MSAHDTTLGEILRLVREIHEATTRPPPPSPRWATPKEAAENFRVSLGTIRRWYKAGRITSARAAGGVRVDLASLPSGRLPEQAHDDRARSLRAINRAHRGSASDAHGRSRKGVNRDHTAAASAPSLPPYLIEAPDPVSEWCNAREDQGERAADAMRDELAEHLRAVEVEPRTSARPLLIRLSLTVPEWSNADALAVHGRALAAWIAADGDGAGAWIVLDVSSAGRPHLHGLALTRRTPASICEEWCGLGGGAQRAQAACLVAGSAGPWNGGNATLRRSLARVVPYALKELPASAGAIDVVDRVITSGALVGVWERAALRSLGSKQETP